MYVDSSTEDTVTGVYGQADWAMTSNFILSAGTRYDYYSTFGGTLNPRVGLNYRPAPDRAVGRRTDRPFARPMPMNSITVPRGKNSIRNCSLKRSGPMKPFWNSQSAKR